MPSILHDWVTTLTLRYQGVLMAAVRGCDGLPKEDPSKAIMRGIRQTVLVPFDARELEIGKNFMSVSESELLKAFDDVIENHDGYPVHFIMHMIHAAEVIGYEHPDAHTRLIWLRFYQSMAHAFHFNSETREQLKSRMERNRLGHGIPTSLVGV